MFGSMVGPTDNTEHIKDHSTGMEGYIEYTEQERNKQGKPT